MKTARPSRSPKTRSYPIEPYTPAQDPLKISQAILRSPILSGLMHRAQASEARLAVIAHLLPPGLKDTVKAASLDKTQWCLLAPHNSAAAKLRQLIPILEEYFAQKGLPAVKVTVAIAKNRTPQPPVANCPRD